MLLLTKSLLSLRSILIESNLSQEVRKKLLDLFLLTLVEANLKKSPNSVSENPKFWRLFLMLNFWFKLVSPWLTNAKFWIILLVKSIIKRSLLIIIFHTILMFILSLSFSLSTDYWFQRLFEGFSFFDWVVTIRRNNSPLGKREVLEKHAMFIRAIPKMKIKRDPKITNRESLKESKSDR